MKTLLRAVAALAFTATLATAASAARDPDAAPRYRLQDLGVLPGDDYSIGTALNNRGEVAGGSYPRRGDGGRLFIYRDGRMQPAGPLAGDYGQASDLNDRGDVAGSSTDASGHLRPFLQRNGQRLDLATALGARTGSARGLNASGQVIGEADGRAFFHDGTRSQYLLFEGSPGRSIGTAVNDLGVGVGGVQTDSGFRSFVYAQGRVELLPNPEEYEGWGDFYGVDINEAGQVLVSHAYTADDYGGTLIWDQGRYERIGGLGDFGIALNNRGWVLYENSYFDDEWGDYNWTPALYRDGSSWHLRDLLSPDTAAHWEIGAAYGLNDAGQIVGSGRRDGELRAFLATPVPEPAHAALLLVGLGVVGAAATRRKRLSAASGPAGSA